MNKIFYFVLLVFLTACSEKTGEVNTKVETIDPVEVMNQSGVSFKMISQEKGEDDSKSPLGYWQSLISYPEIYGAITDSVKTKINNTIASLSTKYSCDSYGDYSFSSVVKYLDAEILSTTYEVMWLCSKMRSPSSQTGALTFNLKTGESVLLESAFLNKDKMNKFYSLVSNKIENHLKNSKECPVKNSFDYFFKSKHGLVFVAEMERHSDSGCISEFQYTVKDLAEYLKPDSFLLN